MVKWGYRVTKNNKLLLFKGLRDGDSENNAAISNGNLTPEFTILYYPTIQFGHGVNWAPNYWKI
jgi:hypothetical protein